MNQEMIETARAAVSNLLGERLARKASDAFLLAMGRPSPMMLGLESAADPVRPRPVVLEFTAQPQVRAEINGAVERVRGTRAWASLRTALKKIELEAVTKGVTTEVMESGRSEPELLPVQAARLLRHVKVVSVRDNFFKVSGTVTAGIERGARNFQRAGAEAVSAARSRAPITEVCWLNRTVRSWADPRALAEVAADDSIERVDLPRRLQPEIRVSMGTVGGPAFRKKFKRTGKGIIVAVIDSEVALSHPALKGRVVHKQNFTSEPWGAPDSHGTAVAGIIASNDKKFTGMAPEATIYNYKVIATSDAFSGDDFDGALAIQQALEDGAHIANCSWGAGLVGPTLSREAVACDEAWALGLTVVKSSGNRGPGDRTCTTPADADGVIVVGATDREGTAVQDYSSRGPAVTKVRPHLIAPGGGDGGGIASCLVGGGFGDVGVGTSYAAPHVSGMLALLLDRDADLTPDDLRDKLLAACVPLAGVDANVQGAGLVSLSRVV